MLRRLPIAGAAGGPAAIAILALVAAACSTGAPSPSGPATSPTATSPSPGAASPSAPASPADTTVVRVAAQPVLALNQWYLADKLGYFADNGVSIQLVKYYPSGAPQVEAGLRGEWDVAFMGELPAVTGGAKWGMQTIGLFGDEAAAHGMYVRPADNVNASDPAADLRGQNVLYTQGSAGQVFLEACLKKWGLTPNDVKLVNLSPPDLVAAFKGGNGRLAQAYPPFSYQLEAAGFQNICDTTTVGVHAYPTMVAHPDFVRDHPELLARFVEAVFRANELYLDDPAKALELVKDFYKEAGVEQSDEDIKRTMGVYDWATLEEAQRIFKSGDAASSADAMLDMLVRNGLLESKPQPLFVNGDPIDRAVAYRASVGR